MVKFSIGYNHTKSFLEIIPMVKSHVEEIYFQSPSKIMASGRVITPEKGYEKNIERIIKECKKTGIKSNILLNATCEGKDAGEEKTAEKIIQYLKKLKSIGLDRVSVANLTYVPRIKKEIKGLEVQSSVNCYLKSVEHARYLKELGVDTITIDRDINRNIPIIKKIKKETGLKIKVLLNEGCLENCPFRHVHFNMISHKKDTSYFDSTSCVLIYRQNPKKIFKIPFIRPEDLKRYIGVADYFKISTRTSPTMSIINMLNAYKTGRYDGNLLVLLSTKGLFSHFRSLDNRVLSQENFFEKMTKCDDECEKCGYCDELLKKACKFVN